MRPRWRLAPAVAAALLLGGAAPAPPPPASLPVDRNVDPCSDFYRYACDAWIAANPMPPDQSRWTRLDALALQTRQELRGLLDQAVAHPAPESRELAAYYAACTDLAAIESKGLAPLQPELDRIAALAGPAELPALVARLHSFGVPVFFRFDAEPDDEDSGREVATLDQGGFGLPERGDYLAADARPAALRAAYRAHVATMLGLLGPGAGAGADAVLRIETALARAALSPVERRDPAAIYHSVSLAELADGASGFDWNAYFRATGAPAFVTLDLRVPGFIAAFDRLLRTTPLDDLKAYLRWQLVHRAAAFLPDSFRAADFAFYGGTLEGETAAAPRWRRCVEATDRALGEPLGRLYVAQYFPPAARSHVEALLRDLHDAFAEDLEAVPWMGTETRAAALRKLDAMTAKIGAPAAWHGDAVPGLRPDDALGNLFRARASLRRRQLAKIGNPVDPADWRMTPASVNADYSRAGNDIDFPAGILQPPFFDAAGDDALNDGAIGAVIGHEMTHGFDEGGRQFGPHGTRENWWTPRDLARFKDRAACFVREYGGFTSIDGRPLDGTQTLAENLADNGGVRLALRALVGRLGGGESASGDRLAAERRFFLGYAGLWCGSIRPEAARRRAASDPHAPAPFRVNGVLANIPEFATAFGCPAGSPMRRTELCRVW